MRLLILGGTRFLGRHTVDAALCRGHEVTLFNRGLHNPNLFPEAEHLKGDRNHDLTPLHGRRFDAVIDTCAYRPEQVETLLTALAEAPRHYTLVSSISVYASFPPGVQFDENAAVLPNGEGDDSYGALKAACEAALLRRPSIHAAIVRPGLIVGPHDPTGRFTYWLRRMDRGGHVLAPGRPERPIQFIDARDLAEWFVHAAEQATTGIFNAVRPPAQLTMARLLEACEAQAKRGAQIRWLDEASIAAAGVAPWTELPLWVPEDHPDFGGFMLARSERAVAAGLTFRPLEQTVADTLAWSREVPDEPPSPEKVTPLSPEREQALLRD